MTKEEVRKLAEKGGLPVKYKEESQDFYSGDYGDLIPLVVRGFTPSSGMELTPERGLDFSLIAAGAQLVDLLL